MTPRWTDSLLGLGLNKSQLKLLREELQSEGILYSTWIEMPEEQEIC
jgi:hypothetical protein